MGAAHASINGITAGKFKQGDFFGEIAFVATCKKVLGDKKDTASQDLTLRHADVVRGTHQRHVELISFSAIVTGDYMWQVATKASTILELSVQDFLTVARGSCDDDAGNRIVLETLTRTSDEHLANAARIHQYIEAQNASMVKEAFSDSGYFYLV